MSDGRKTGDWRNYANPVNQYFTWVYYGITASRSSSIYGRSSTIRPESRTYKFFIRY